MAAERRGPDADVSRSAGAGLARYERVTVWLNGHASVLLLATAAAAVLESAAPIAVAAAASFAFLLIGERRVLTAIGPLGGIANLITAGRCALVLTVAAFMPQMPFISVLMFMVISALLDFFDGYAARRFAQESTFGTNFDREADALFVLVAYSYFFVVGDIGAWILLPGALPYVYRLCVAFARDRSEHERKRKLPAFLAGTNYIVLFLAAIVPLPFRMPMLTASCSVIGLSFLLSFVDLYRHERKVGR